MSRQQLTLGIALSDYAKYVSRTREENREPMKFAEYIKAPQMPPRKVVELSRAMQALLTPTPTGMSLRTNRMRFESWASIYTVYPLPLRCDADGHYHDLTVQGWWDAW